MGTLTTVGYGDMTPTTICGKIVGAATMLWGVVIVSASVAVITTSFTEQYNKKISIQKAVRCLRKTRADLTSGDTGRTVDVCDGPKRPPPGSPRSLYEHTSITTQLSELDEEVSLAFVRLEGVISRMREDPLHHDGNLQRSQRAEYAMIALKQLQQQARGFFSSAGSFAAHIAEMEAESQGAYAIYGRLPTPHGDIA